MHTVTTPVPPLQLISWAPPPWADTIGTEGDQIECSRTLGVVPEEPNCAGDALKVIMIQRDEIRPDRDRIAVVRHPVEILVGGVSLSSSEARGLGHLVRHAVAVLHRPTFADPQS